MKMRPRKKMATFKFNKKVHSLYEGPNTVGRDIFSIVQLGDMKFSKHHALIFILDDLEQYICDFKSANGTRLNGSLISPLIYHRLKYGDKITLGNVTGDYEKFVEWDTSHIPPDEGAQNFDNDMDYVEVRRGKHKQGTRRTWKTGCCSKTLNQTVVIDDDGNETSQRNDGLTQIESQTILPHTVCDSPQPSTSRALDPVHTPENIPTKEATTNESETQLIEDDVEEIDNDKESTQMPKENEREVQEDTQGAETQAVTNEAETEPYMEIYERDSSPFLCNDIEVPPPIPTADVEQCNVPAASLIPTDNIEVKSTPITIAAPPSQGFDTDIGECSFTSTTQASVLMTTIDETVLVDDSLNNGNSGIDDIAIDDDDLMKDFKDSQESVINFKGKRTRMIPTSDTESDMETFDKGIEAYLSNMTSNEVTDYETDVEDSDLIRTKKGSKNKIAIIESESENSDKKELENDKQKDNPDDCDLDATQDIMPPPEEYLSTNDPKINQTEEKDCDDFIIPATQFLDADFPDSNKISDTQGARNLINQIVSVGNELSNKTTAQNRTKDTNGKNQDMFDDDDFDISTQMISNQCDTSTSKNDTVNDAECEDLFLLSTQILSNQNAVLSTATTSKDLTTNPIDDDIFFLPTQVLAKAPTVAEPTDEIPEDIFIEPTQRLNVDRSNTTDKSQTNTDNEATKNNSVLSKTNIDSSMNEPNVSLTNNDNEYDSIFSLATQALHKPDSTKNIKIEEDDIYFAATQEVTFNLPKAPENDVSTVSIKSPTSSNEDDNFSIPTQAVTYLPSVSSAKETTNTSVGKVETEMDDDVYCLSTQLLKTETIENPQTTSAMECGDVSPVDDHVFSMPTQALMGASKNANNAKETKNTSVEKVETEVDDDVYCLSTQLLKTETIESPQTTSAIECGDVSQVDDHIFSMPTQALNGASKNANKANMLKSANDLNSTNKNDAQNEMDDKSGKNSVREQTGNTNNNMKECVVKISTLTIQATKSKQVADTKDDPFDKPTQQLCGDTTKTDKVRKSSRLTLRKKGDNIMPPINENQADLLNVDDTIFDICTQPLKVKTVEIDGKKEAPKRINKNIDPSTSEPIVQLQINNTSDVEKATSAMVKSECDPEDDCNSHVIETDKNDTNAVLEVKTEIKTEDCVSRTDVNFNSTPQLCVVLNNMRPTNPVGNALCLKNSEDSLNNFEDIDEDLDDEYCNQETQILKPDKVNGKKNNKSVPKAPTKRNVKSKNAPTAPQPSCSKETEEPAEMSFIESDDEFEDVNKSTSYSPKTKRVAARKRKASKNTKMYEQNPEIETFSSDENHKSTAIEEESKQMNETPSKRIRKIPQKYRTDCENENIIGKAKVDNRELNVNSKPKRARRAPKNDDFVFDPLEMASLENSDRQIEVSKPKRKRRTSKKSESSGDESSMIKSGGKHKLSTVSNPETSKRIRRAPKRYVTLDDEATIEEYSSGENKKSLSKKPCDEPAKSVEIEKTVVTSAAQNIRRTRKDLNATRTDSPTNFNDKRKLKVVFTMLNDPSLETTIKSLGGEIVESIYECSVLVTHKISRSLKFLLAVILCKPIVGVQWVSDCKLKKKILDPWLYILDDPETEAKYEFKLREALNRAKQSKLMEGYCILPIVSKHLDVIREISELSGAVCLSRPPTKSATANLIVVSYEEDRSKYMKYKKQNSTVVAAEAIFSGILRQEFQWDKYLLE